MNEFGLVIGFFSISFYLVILKPFGVSNNCVTERGELQLHPWFVLHAKVCYGV